MGWVDLHGTHITDVRKTWIHQHTVQLRKNRGGGGRGASLEHSGLGAPRLLLCLLGNAVGSFGSVATIRVGSPMLLHVVLAGEGL